MSRGEIRRSLLAIDPPLVLPVRETSPYVNRIRLLWQKMREPVIDLFPKPPGLPRNVGAYVKHIDQAYVTDAYHSLSIKRYRITADLIERVRQRNAMAARGYWQAYQAVRKSVDRVLKGENPGLVAEESFALCDSNFTVFRWSTESDTYRHDVEQPTAQSGVRLDRIPGSISGYTGMSL